MELLKVEEILTKSIASDELKSDVIEYLKKHNLNYVIHGTFTDYGGSVIDKIYFLYFKKYRKELKKDGFKLFYELTIYDGANFFIIFKNDEEALKFNDRLDEYLLFFDNIEEFYSNLEFEEKLKAFKIVLNDYRLETGKRIPKVLSSQLFETFFDYSSLETWGVDYSTSTIFEKFDEILTN